LALKRLAFGAAALSAARATQTALTFLTLPLLARLLAPEEFGLVALATSFVLFTIVLSDAGLGQSLVRTPAEQKTIWSSAFWAISILSGGLALLLLATAWPAAWLFNEPRLAPLVMALAPLPLVQGMLAPAIADLQQREKFGLLALAEVVGAICGITAAVVVALADGGAWALVSQQLALWTGKAIVLVSTTRFRPQFVLELKELGEHVRFGRDTVGWGLINLLARQVDPMVIAKLIGTAALGIYSMAYRLMTLPGFLISGPLQSTLYTRMVVLRHDIPRLRTLFLIASRAVATFVFPPMLILSVASSPFIEVFLSARWAPVAVLFAFMAPVGALQAVTNLNGALLMATGRTDLRLRLTLEITVLWVIAIPFLALQGILAVGIGSAAVFLVYLPRALQLILRPIETRISTYLAAIAAPVAISAGMAGFHLLMRAVLPLTPWAEIGLAMSEILIGYGLTAWLLRGQLTSDLRTMRSLFIMAAQTHLAPSEVAAAPAMRK
jgi:O-antigen/teichoic acid export membrane protein